MTTNTTSKICVLGLGYIGLPTASIFAMHGHSVVGVDVHANVVDTVNSGEIHIEEPGLRTLVRAGVQSGNLRASLQAEPADVFIVAVPTPCVGDPDSSAGADLHYVEDAMCAVLPHVRAGNLVILESTSPPGTTEQYCAAPLRTAGFTPGEDVFVAHCPERVLPGHILRELTQNDRIVGGITQRCAERARDLYGCFVEGAIHLTTATTAELVKLMENTYRDVNIALANELADICVRLDISAPEVTTLANCHPRVHLHQAGPGVGGHCLPLDPWFVIEAAPEEATLIRAARLRNRSVPATLVQRCMEALAGVDKPRVALFGVAYKPNVDDARESPAQQFIDAFEQQGVEVRCFDPHVRRFKHELHTLEAAVTDADMIVVTTGHSEFRFLDPTEIGALMRTRQLSDFCACVAASKWREAGYDVLER